MRTRTNATNLGKFTFVHLRLFLFSKEMVEEELVQQLVKLQKINQQQNYKQPNKQVNGQSWGRNISLSLTKVVLEEIRKKHKTVCFVWKTSELHSRLDSFWTSVSDEVSSVILSTGQTENLRSFCPGEIKETARGLKGIALAVWCYKPALPTELNNKIQGVLIAVCCLTLRMN